TAPVLTALLRQANALAIGAVAGLAGARIGMPLPWMLGPLIGTIVAAMAGAPISAPGALRPAVIPVLGVLLGSSLSAEVLRSAAAWLPSLLLLPVYLAVSTLLAMVVYIRLGGFDRVTAFF